MTFTSGPKTGLPTNIDLDDTTWTTKYLNGNAAWEDRVSKITANNPNGAVVGDYYGQPCWSTARGVVYECIKPGPASGSTAAIWVPRDYVAVGSFHLFLRPQVPTGYLPCNGTVRLKSDYPILHSVLADSLKTNTTFTLPEIRGLPLSFRHPLGTELLPLVGQFNNNVPLSAGASTVFGVLNVVFGVKY